MRSSGVFSLHKLGRYLELIPVQVANMADCIKVAVDFVSPENITRCEQLTREFQEQNQSKIWKEDVLQLRTMMWFAWQTCCQQESTHTT
jgi:lysine-specific demethylase 3